MPHYLAIHREPAVPRERIAGRWVELAKERRAIWLKTWYNFNNGRRFCWWDAPHREALEEIFRDHEVPWEEIIEVEHTTPADRVGRED